jgi:hypothetical protein
MFKPVVSLLILCMVFHFTLEIHAQNKNNGTKMESPGLAKQQVGENYGGGRIFWLDETGQHGLVAALADQSAKGIAWNPGNSVVTGANADTVYSGQTNSGKIVTVQGKNDQNAARLCLDHSVTSNGVVYDDWYLPSKFELNLLFQQRTVVGGFNTSSGIYWSSTESTEAPANSAWEQEFRFGSPYEDDKDVTDQVRCIRKF